MGIIVRTTYTGATDTRGSRVTAKAYGRELSWPYNYALSQLEMHASVAEALALAILDGIGLGVKYVAPKASAVAVKDAARGYVFDVEISEGA